MINIFTIFLQISQIETCIDKVENYLQRVQHWVLLKRSKNFSPSAVRHCPSSSAVRPPPYTSPDIEPVRPLPSPLGPILLSKWGQSRSGSILYALKCKHLYRIDPTLKDWPQVERRTADRGNVRESFLWADGGQKET